MRCLSSSNAGGAVAAVATALAVLAPPAIHAGDDAKLRHLLDQDCGSCHGLTRKGGLGSSLEPAALAGFSDEELVRVIMDGLPGTAMPPWKAVISHDEARALVRMLRSEARP